MRSSETSRSAASPRRSRRASRIFAAVAPALVAIGAGAAGCASAPDRPPDAAAGGRLFVDTCAACHALPDPEEHEAREWKVILRRMGPRAGLDPAEQRDVVEYLAGGGR